MLDYGRVCLSREQSVAAAGVLSVRRLLCRICARVQVSGGEQHQRAAQPDDSPLAGIRGQLVWAGCARGCLLDGAKWTGLSDCRDAITTAFKPTLQAASCKLPASRVVAKLRRRRSGFKLLAASRSEERRVGKESRWRDAGVVAESRKVN